MLKVKKLLTDEQLSKYAKDEAKRAKQSGNDSDDGWTMGRPDGPPPGGGPVVVAGRAAAVDLAVEVGRVAAGQARLS